MFQQDTEKTRHGKICNQGWQQHWCSLPLALGLVPNEQWLGLAGHWAMPPTFWVGKGRRYHGNSTSGESGRWGYWDGCEMQSIRLWRWAWTSFEDHRKPSWVDPAGTVLPFSSCFHLSFFPPRAKHPVIVLWAKRGRERVLRTPAHLAVLTEKSPLLMGSASQAQARGLRPPRRPFLCGFWTRFPPSLCCYVLPWFRASPCFIHYKFPCFPLSEVLKIWAARAQSVFWNSSAISLMLLQLWAFF